MTTGSIGRDRNAIICTACGAANSPGSRFCERCGTRLPQQPGVNRPIPAMPIPIPPPSAAEVPGPHPVAPAASETPDTPSARVEAAQESPINDEAPDPSDASDSPTVTIDLAPTRESTRDAPTETFDLPQMPRPTSDAPTATPTPPGAPLPSGDQPTQVGSGWNYRSWTPASGGAAQAPGPGDATPPEAPPREIAPTPIAPPAEVIRFTRPAADAGAAPHDRLSTSEEPPLVAPMTGPLTYPVGGAASGGGAAHAGQPYGVGDTANGDDVSGGAPGMGQPYGAGGSAPPPAGYMANAGQYPAPAAGSNNRTLWIILGVIGGLALLCIIICLLIVVVAAVGASGTTGVATSVATATRR